MAICKQFNTTIKDNGEDIKDSCSNVKKHILDLAINALYLVKLEKTRTGKLNKTPWLCEEVNIYH